MKSGAVSRRTYCVTVPCYTLHSKGGNRIREAVLVLECAWPLSLLFFRHFANYRQFSYTAAVDIQGTLLLFPLMNPNLIRALVRLNHESCPGSH